MPRGITSYSTETDGDQSLFMGGVGGWGLGVGGWGLGVGGYHGFKERQGDQSIFIEGGV